MRRLGLNRRRAVALAAAAMLLSACTGAATPQWTFGPVSSAGAAAAQTAPPTAPPTSAPTSSPTSAPTSQPTAAPTSGSSTGPIGVPPTGVAIYVSEWSVGLPTSMLTGQVNFGITNIGTMPHELLVFRSDLPPSSYPVDSKGTIVEDGPGITLVSRGDTIDSWRDAGTGCRSHPARHVSLRLQPARALQGGHVPGRHRDVPVRSNRPMLPPR